MNAAARGEVLATLAIVGTFVVLVGHRPIWRRFAEHPSQQQCTALLNRYVEHLSKAASPDIKTSEIEQRQALARAKAAEDSAFARCPIELTRQEAECAMRAPNADEFERCLP